MSFINWGHESPEQKVIRRKFEDDQALFEQMVSAATAAAAAAGGGSISGPKYCGGDKTMQTYIFPGIDLLDDSEFAPTSDELLTFDEGQRDKETEYRASRDARLKADNENHNAEWIGRITEINPLPDYAPSTVFHKGILRESETTWWKPLTAYEQWTAEITRDEIIFPSAAEVLPGITEVSVLIAIELKADLPSTGKPGEIITVFNDPFEDGINNGLYAWDEVNSEFSNEFFNTYFAPTFDARRADRDKSLKAKNEVMLAMTPFIWASYYIPDYRIVKDNLL